MRCFLLDSKATMTMHFLSLNMHLFECSSTSCILQFITRFELPKSADIVWSEFPEGCPVKS